jgi:hypothetical protein
MLYSDLFFRQFPCLRESIFQLPAPEFHQFFHVKRAHGRPPVPGIMNVVRVKLIRIHRQ